MGRKVPAFGPLDARIMVVGEAPGAEEEREGKPFVGPAGRLIRRHMLEEGIDPDDVFWTNICKERPPKNDLSRFFDGTGFPLNVVLDGLEELVEEILEVQPNVIYAAGNYPLWALTGKGRWDFIKKKGTYGYMGISQWRGNILECRLGKAAGAKVVAGYHPAYIAREGMQDHGLFKVDLARVLRESAFPEIRRPQKDFLIDPQGADRNYLRDRILGAAGTVTLDIEYIGKNLLCVGLTDDAGFAACVPTRTEADIGYVRDLLLSGVPLCAQNAMFDLSVLAWHSGIDAFEFLKYDTMLAAHAINIELPKDLETLASIYTDQPSWKDAINWKKIKSGAQPIEDVWDYNCIDVWVTHEVMEKQIAEDLTDEAVREVFEFEMALVEPLWRCSLRGMKVDTEQIEAASTVAAAKIAVYGERLAQIAGGEINVKSNKQVGDLLFGQLGLKPTKLNKTGPATDDKTVADLLIKCETDIQREVITLIRDIREQRDLGSKFLDVEMDEDGRCRGMYNPGGTDTGRLSSKKFYPTGKGLQQQNIPKAKLARRCFVPDPGKIFGYFDLERAESLVVAQITGDPLMLKHHEPGTDAHRGLASLLFGKPEEEITDDERYMGKQTRHAGNYMMGWMTFMKNVNKYANKTGVSIEARDAKMFIGRYRELHPFLEQWWAEVKQELWRSRQLKNLLGRPRTFFSHINSVVPNAVAYVPQSTVGDVLNVGLLNAHGIESPYIRRLGLWEHYAPMAEELRDYGFEFLLQVHDAIGFQCNEKDAERVAELMVGLMTVPLINPRIYEPFCIPVEAGLGPNWGDVAKHPINYAEETEQLVTRLSGVY